MFNVIVSRRRRSVWTPKTVALSAGAHALFFGGVVLASAAQPERAARDDEPQVTWVEPARPEPQKPETPPPPPEKQPEPKSAPVPGATLQVDNIEKVPDRIPEPDLNAKPVTAEQFSGQGPIGNVIGPPPATPTPPAADPDPAATVYSMETVEDRPGLANTPEVQRMLRRSYPTTLQDAGVTGRVLLEMVVNADGRVEPGTVKVVEATHPGFAEASIRVAERMRFRPARINGTPVRVSVTMPIDWSIEN